jgi:hypothetical protein
MHEIEWTMTMQDTWDIVWTLAGLGWRSPRRVLLGALASAGVLGAVVFAVWSQYGLDAGPATVAIVVIAALMSIALAILVVGAVLRLLTMAGSTVMGWFSSRA